MAVSDVYDVKVSNCTKPEVEHAEAWQILASMTSWCRFTPKPEVAVFRRKMVP